VLDDQHRVVVHIALANLNDAHRASAERNRVAARQIGATVWNVGGSAGVPSSWRSAKVNAIRPPLGWGRTARRGYRPGRYAEERRSFARSRIRSVP
jgi:hypothetical protein